MKLNKLVSLLALSIFAISAEAATPEVVAAAVKEGKVVIYSATDQKSASPLIKDFEATYPGIKVEYHDMNTTELYNRFIAESAAGSSADVTWSSSMDLQVKLANDGYALAYKSSEAANLPSWAVWRDEAYGTTYEPLVFVYNKRLTDPADVPQSHADLTRLLNTKADKYKGKLTTYDPERSGVGFMLLAQDELVNASGYAAMTKAFGAANVRVQASTGTMMERVSSGENLLGYNILGSYALLRAKQDPNIGIVYPKDYVLVLSRVMLIAKKAKNQNAAKLWLDYVLSKRGQEKIANECDLYSLREDVSGETNAAALRKQLGAALKPVPIGPGLLSYLDQAKRLEFLKQWKTAIAP
jgi:iron(III) transport system substrate-binding protein